MTGFQELPALDSQRCTGCCRCTDVCPAACLVMHWDQPMLALPRACVSCALCVRICPEDALRMERRWCG